jgi:LPXTG-motif cell wall-anchored protein
MRITTTMAGLLMLALAGGALAQTKVDRSFTTTSKDCSGVQWSKEALATYPTIASACQGVEVRDGKTFVRFEGTVQRNVEQGKQLVVRFKDGGDITISPPPETVVYINDKKTPVKNLSRGDELNFYIAEDRFTAQLPQEQNQLVSVPIVYRETTTYREPEQTAAVLPATGTNRGLTLILAIGALALASALTLRRRQGH